MAMQWLTTLITKEASSYMYDQAGKMWTEVVDSSFRHYVITLSSILMFHPKLSFITSLVVVAARVASTVVVRAAAVRVARIAAIRRVSASGFALLTAFVGQAFVLEHASSLLHQLASGRVILAAGVVVVAVAAAGLVAVAL